MRVVPSHLQDATIIIPQGRVQTDPHTVLLLENHMQFFGMTQHAMNQTQRIRVVTTDMSQQQRTGQPLHAMHV